MSKVPAPRHLMGRGRLVSAVLAIAALAGACSSDTAPAAPRELDGSPVSVGGGTAATYVIMGANGPSALGVKLTASALNGLPSSDNEWTLPLPAGLAAAPWDHVMLDWNAQGHPPGPYEVPHFDFHFYVITPAQQAAIQGGPDTVTVPAADVPRDYASGVMAVPDMGTHWIDTTAAELHGQPFTSTLIYGFYHGSMAFVEPMVTRAVLSSQPNVTATVKQPQAFQKPGAYPRSYSVRYDAASQTIRVELDSLANH